MKLSKSVIAMLLPLALTACQSTTSSVDEYTLDSTSSAFSNTFKPYRNDTGVVDKFADLRIYQVMVESFQNGDDSRNYDTGYGPSDHKGDIKGIINAIPYIKNLGMNAIWLTPIFESAKEDEKNPSMLDATGYYTRNYYKVDRRFGDENTLKELVDTAHAHGLYVFLDGVFGHFRDDLVNTSPKGNKVTITKKCLGGNLQPYEPPKNTSCANFEDDGSSQKYMEEVARYYVKNFKIDGWRLDQAYQVPPIVLASIKKAVTDESSKVTYKDLKGEIVHPLAYLVGEIWSDNNTIRERGYGSDKEPILDSNFDFGLRYGLVQAFAMEEWGKKDNSAFRIHEALKYDENNLPSHAYPNLMITNHDLLRFGDLIQRAKYDDTYQNRIEIALSYLAIAHSGPITHYYGEEIGQEVPNFADRKDQMGYYDDHVARDNGKIANFTAQEQKTHDLLKFLMNLRSKHGSISNGKLEFVKLNRNIFAIKKTFKGDADIYYILNLSTHDSAKFNLTKDLVGNHELYKLDVNGNTKLTKNTLDEFEVTVKPLSFAVLSTSKD